MSQQQIEAKQAQWNTLKNSIQAIVNKALSQPGVTAAEVGGGLDTGLSATVRMGDVETIEFNRDKSLGITVYKGQCKGHVSLSDMSDAAIDSAMTAACHIAEYTEPDEYAGLADADLMAKQYPDLNLHHPTVVSAEEAIEYAKQCEAAALNFDKKITNSDGASCYTSERYYVYANSHGFVGAYPTTRYGLSCSVIGESQGAMQRDYDYTVSRQFDKLAAGETIGKQAAMKTLKRLGSKKIATCQAPVLFIAEIARGLFGHFIQAISGGNLYRKSSFLLDAIDSQIFPKWMRIQEQPLLPAALGSAAFDNEGVATREKDFITDGILKSYVLGSYSARRLGLQTTANAGGVHNLSVMPGTQTFEALIKSMRTGLIVTEVMGHGLNLVTGDYSKGAAGFWVENGEIQFPVEEVTIAANLKDLYANMLAVGNDVDSRGNIRTGSVLVEQMTIAGN